MPEHTLPDGMRWIANLKTLGSALGYVPEPEYDVSQDDEPVTPVDVAWLRSTDDRFPLFVFEVESVAGTQLANNALKVFAQDTRLFEKPLFHFHAVLDGGETSNRVKNTQEMFGRFNYRIYPDAAKGAGTDMVKDLLSQHRRVSDHIDIGALAIVLDAQAWPELNLDEVWLHAEACDFRVPWEQAYAELAIDDDAFLGRLVRRLEQALARGEHIAGEHHDRHVTSAWEPLLHAGILAALRPELAESCLGQARRAQGASTNRRIAPAYGRSADNDDLVYAYSPALWAALAAALAHPAATAWALEELALVLGEPQRPTRSALSALSAVWMLHISRAGGDEHQPAFARAAAHLDATGGIAPTIWREPPGQGGLMALLDDWAVTLAEGAQPAPSWDQLMPPQADDRAHQELVAQLLGVLTGRLSNVAGEPVRVALWASAEEAPAAAVPPPPAAR